jgi:pimeloyl-ACP methyl ester carboxylesterase
LYGRGTSDYPKRPYNLDLFDTQLKELITVLGLTLPVDLVGLSMGGCVSVVFCDRHSDSVRRLVLIDPAGYGRNPLRFAKVVTVPILGELILCILGRKKILSSIAKLFHGGDEYLGFIDMACQQMEFIGYGQALLSTLRSGVLDDNSGSYHRVGKQERSSLLIWGTEDRAVPFQKSKKVREVIPQIEFHAIDGAGHVPHYERPEVVIPLIVEFLSRK